MPLQVFEIYETQEFLENKPGGNPREVTRVLAAIEVQRLPCSVRNSWTRPHSILTPSLTIH